MSTRTEAPIADLRSRRTRKWLQNALLALMAEKPFREIRITEIADRAEVSRPAFYLHFRSKEELLLSHVDAVFDAFHEALSADIAEGRIDRRRFCVMLFDYWGQYAGTLRMVIQADVEHVLLDRLRDYFSAIMAELHARTGRQVDPVLQAFRVDFAAGGAYQLLTRWIMAGMPYPPEQMGALLYELMGACV